MGEYITSYNGRKVSDYLSTGKYKSALFVFHHGLGDCVMWEPVFEELKRLYPAINIQQSVHCGQENLFRSAPTDTNLYDITFVLGFPCNEHSHPEYTKAEYCCKVELGIPAPATVIKINKVFPSPFVGTHFFSTSNPVTYGVKEDVARKVHDTILEAGLIPIDTDMRHIWANSYNKKFEWNTCAIDKAKADTRTLAGVIQRCRGFCGSASGNLLLATTLLPVHRILYLKQNLPLNTFTRLPLLVLDTHKYDKGVIVEWIERIKEDD